MSVITNKQKSYLSKAFIEQSNIVMCVANPNTLSGQWESPYSENSPEPEISSISSIANPIVYKNLGLGPHLEDANQSVIAFAKPDVTGTVEYRGTMYLLTADWGIALSEDYTSVYIKGTLVEDEISSSISYRIIGLYIDTVGNFDSDTNIAQITPTYTNWETTTDYTIETSFVYDGDTSRIYKCLETHESTIFVDDLAAGKWVLYDCIINPGLLSIIDYRKPIYRASDQTECIEIVIPF